MPPVRDTFAIMVYVKPRHLREKRSNEAISLVRGTLELVDQERVALRDMSTLIERGRVARKRNPKQAFDSMNKFWLNHCDAQGNLARDTKVTSLQRDCHTGFLVNWPLVLRYYKKYIIFVIKYYNRLKYYSEDILLRL